MLRIGLAAAVVLSVSVLLGAGVGSNHRLSMAEGKVRVWRIAELRKQGPAGLEAALAEFEALQMSVKKPLPTELDRCRTAVDQIAGQRHATISRLFWYTDLEVAKSIAEKSGKPILSLRMLGKLTDEFSCANSRFFRTSLYANRTISKTMREKFVLHWQSVRPVPKVTIDFGDGRKLERTVTGNSAHYVLDSTGRPLDVLPGLYNPQEFLAWLEHGEQLSQMIQDKHLVDPEEMLADYHAERYQVVLNDWQQDLQQAGLQTSIGIGVEPQSGKPAQPPNAQQAGARAYGKFVIEAPILKLLDFSPEQTEQRLDNEDWQKIADLHREETQLDASSRRLIRSTHPSARVAGARAATKRLVEDPILRVVRQFEDSIALDTVRNEYLLHRQIHQWFAKGTAPADLETFNERVYAELFLTPSSDPWLGLAPDDSYTALEAEGLSVTK